MHAYLGVPEVGFGLLLPEGGGSTRYDMEYPVLSETLQYVRLGVSKSQSRLVSQQIMSSFTDTGWSFIVVHTSYLYFRPTLIYVGGLDVTVASPLINGGYKCYDETNSIGCLIMQNNINVNLSSDDKHALWLLDLQI